VAPRRRALAVWSPESRRETRALKGDLRDWFAVLHVRNTATDTVITARPPPKPQEGMYPPPVEVLSRAAWATVRLEGCRGGVGPTPLARSP
jgi:hypothetical protein